MSNLIHALKRNDSGISPVIGTILMVAATVIIAGAVYAAVNAYSGKSNKAPTDASWKAQGVDSDGNGLDDTIKITYLSGPTSATGITFSVTQANGTALNAGPAINSGTGWNSGDYQTYALKYGPGASGSTTVYVTVSQGGSTVLDQSIVLRQ